MSAGSALLLLENEGLPRDRRVWDECRTLVAAGWQVDAVCPAVPDASDPEEELDGVRIHRFPLTPAGGPGGYAREYGHALVRMRSIVRRLARSERFDVVHVASPPDFLHLAARPARGAGAALIFDHHDLSPELYLERFRHRGPAYRLLQALERRAFGAADIVLATNESFRRIAMERGGIAPEDVYVVRNGPDLERFRPVPPDPELRRGRRFLIAYLGVMGPQDGIDHGLLALAELQRLRGPDWRAIFIGSGEILGEMQQLAGSLGLGGQVEFAGWQGDDFIRRVLSSSDVCLAPDPPGPLNDVSTMVKIPEYMAMGRAIAGYDLPETLISAGDAAAYAESATPAGLGRCVDALLNDPERRAELGARARERVSSLSWASSKRALLDAYGAAREVARARRSEESPASGRVPVSDPPDAPGEPLG